MQRPHTIALQGRTPTSIKMSNFAGTMFYCSGFMAERDLVRWNIAFTVYAGTGPLSCATVCQVQKKIVFKAHEHFHLIAKHVANFLMTGANVMICPASPITDIKTSIIVVTAMHKYLSGDMVSRTLGRIEVCQDFLWKHQTQVVSVGN